MFPINYSHISINDYMRSGVAARLSDQFTSDSGDRIHSTKEIEDALVLRINPLNENQNNWYLIFRIELNADGNAKLIDNIQHLIPLNSRLDYSKCAEPSEAMQEQEKNGHFILRIQENIQKQLAEVSQILRERVSWHDIHANASNLSMQDLCTKLKELSVQNETSINNLFNQNNVNAKELLWKEDFNNSFYNLYKDRYLNLPHNLITAIKNNLESQYRIIHRIIQNTAL